MWITSCGNFKDYRDVDNIADIAVLQNHASMAFNNDLPWQSAMLMEQVLIQAKIPFDIIFDDNLKDLDRYKACAPRSGMSIGRASRNHS